MLTEQFVASVGVPNTAPKTNLSKDAAIFIQQLRPLLAQQHVFKKSATQPNCLAVSSTHIFAAQREKAVVHVYSREKGNQEAIVPFTERITCIALACDGTVLVLGTAEGRIFLWELASGRQISTSQAHLQAVTAVAGDGMGNFLLSASKDSSVHVWSLPALLSFANDGAQAISPTRTFTSHRAEVTTLVTGQSTGFANFAVTASSDKTCLIWDYHTGTILRTYLLPAVPTCLGIEATERAVYVGYEDGSVQLLDLFASAFGSGSIHNVSKQAQAPIQPSQSSLWQSPENLGAVLSISVSFDGSLVLSGHENGSVCSWDVGKNGSPTSLLQNSLPGPVTNLQFLPVSGSIEDQQSRLRAPVVVKPKFGAITSSDAAVPSHYAVKVELVSAIHTGAPSIFEDALNRPAFSTSLLDDGLHELSNWGKAGRTNGPIEQEYSEDFMALDEPAAEQTLSLEQQNSALKAELEALRRLQRASFDKIEKISSEKKVLMHRENKRLAQSNGAGPSGTDGASSLDVDIDDSSSGED